MKHQTLNIEYLATYLILIYNSFITQYWLIFHHFIILLFYCNITGGANWPESSTGPNNSQTPSEYLKVDSFLGTNPYIIAIILIRKHRNPLVLVIWQEDDMKLLFITDASELACPATHDIVCDANRYVCVRVCVCVFMYVCICMRSTFPFIVF